jgi:glucose/arabinose dehydrogenase
VALLLAVAALVGVQTGSSSPPADAAVLASGFSLSTAFSGLTLPTSFRFAPDGHVFVAEKDGVVKSFDNLNDTTASVFADLRPQVYSFVDRGLLSLAVDPQFPTRPYVYVFYTYDHVLGDPAPPPRWNDACAGTGSPVDNGNCVASARLSRLTADPNDLGRMLPGSEKVLVEDWCQQFPVHINGTVAFGSDGALYASHGSSGAAHFTDYGQTGSPPNPCGDPPVPVGGTQTIPTAEGGSLRSQDPQTPGDPYTLGGTLIRVDPDTGAGLAGNPLFASADANARRIVSYGLRMPFRFAPRPGANEMWVGDVGEDLLEEIDRVPIGGPLVNNGWPCYEGERVNTGYAPLNICGNLVAQGPTAILAPFWEYAHNQPAFSGDTCATGSSATSGLAFYPGGSYPPRYKNAMFMADYGRRCVWAMLPGTDGLPDPTKVENLVSDVRGTTDLQIGPGGDLYMNDLIGGTISRLAYSGANRPPTATITADRTNGPAPLTVRFDARSSVDPDGDTLRYEWDLDGDGAYDDSTSATPQRTYTNAGGVDVKLRAIDPGGLAGTTTQRITSGNTQPGIGISSPSTSLRWSVGDEISFSAEALDPDDGVLPASAFDWRLTIEHCPGSCHEHPTGHWAGVRSGSFPTEGHEFPSYLDLTLTVTDSGGLQTTKTIDLFPNVSTVSVTSDPPGLKIDARGQAATPFTRSLITGDRMSVSAPDQNVGPFPMRFDAWSDGGAQSHDIVVTSDRTLSAKYSPQLVGVPDRVVTEAEGASTAQIPVVLDKPSRKTVTVRYSVLPWTAGTNDITPGSGTLTIPAGADRATIAVPIKADTLDEDMEVFVVNIDSPTNALVRDPQAVIELVDNDGPPIFTYISKVDFGWDQQFAIAAAKLGVSKWDMPRQGGNLLRYLAVVNGGNVSPLTPAVVGDYQYATIYTSAADRDAVVAAATQYGLNGTHLHTVGAQVLTYLAFISP